MIKVFSRNADVCEITFSEEELAMIPDLPGISLGHLVEFQAKMEQELKIGLKSFYTKDGYIDRLAQVTFAAQLLCITLKQFKPNLIWLSIYHILKDEFKADNFEIDINPKFEEGIDDNASMHTYSIRRTTD